MKWIENRSVELLCRFVLGGVFVYASVYKILHPVEFAKIVYNYQLLPFVAANFVAMVLPWLELFAGLALIVGVLRFESSLLLSALLVVFIFALSVNLYRGVDIDCGCLTLAEGGRSIGWTTIVEDILLLAAALFVVYRARLEDLSFQGKMDS
jgi:uncharacterized membrane protein YphA (DoxX/SURF4 family)